MQQALVLEQLRANSMQEQIANGSLLLPQKPAPKKAAATAKAKETKDGGNLKCTDAENFLLLDVIEDVLPIGKFPWDHVGARCNRDVAKNRPRAVENLRKRFNVFVNKKPPAGDPDCPPIVKCAKRIDKEIKSKAGLEAVHEGAPPPDFESGEAGSAVAGGMANGNGDATNKRTQKKTDSFNLMAAFLQTDKAQAERKAKRDDLHREDWSQQEMLHREDRKHALDREDRAERACHEDQPVQIPCSGRQTTWRASTDHWGQRALRI